MSSRSASKSDAKSTSKGARPKTKVTETGRLGENGNGDGSVSAVVTVDPDKTIAGRACKVCKGSDNEDMVQCDDCDKWHHYVCVGVAAEEAETHDWSCPKCVAAKGIQGTKTATSEQILQQASGTTERVEPIVTTDPAEVPALSLLPTVLQTLQSVLQKLPSTTQNLPYSSPTFPSASQNLLPNSSKFPDTLNLQLPTLTSLSARQTEIPTLTTKTAVDVVQNLPRELLKESQSTNTPKQQLLLQEAKKDKTTQNQKFFLSAARTSHVQKGQRSGKNASSEASSRSGKAWTITSQQSLKLKLEKLKEERELQQAYLDQKYSILEEMAQQSSSTSETLSRVEDWIQDTNDQHQQSLEQNKTSSSGTTLLDLMLHPPSAVHQPERRRQQPAAQVSVNSRQVNRSSNPQNLPDSVDCNNDAEPPSSRGTYVVASQNTHQNRPGHHEYHPDPCNLSRKQLAARQAISKDLPMFSGNPEEWPLFISMYSSTTEMCGFTNEENVVRLQRSLKGRAYESVKSRLMHPANVPGVIGTLKMLFGQPEAIVHSMITKINALPAMREDRLETVVDFAVSVQNFCATLDACGLEEHMYNITLLHQLVNKLPSTIKLDWARFRQTLPSVNLATFGNWIYSLAEAASAVTIPCAVQDSRTTRTEAHSSRKGNTFLNAHSETSSPDSSSESSQFKSSKHAPHSTATQASSEGCVVCKGCCKSADKCKRFLEFSRDSRWAVVREFGLCRRCLRRHQGGCNTKPCGKSGCEFRHHELLHKDQKGTPGGMNPNVDPPTGNNPPPHQGANPLSFDCNVHQIVSSAVLFRYMPVVLYGEKGTVLTYAFMDEGSALTLLDQDLADELGLNGTKKPLCLRWTGGTQRTEKNSREVCLDISGSHGAAKKFNLGGVRTVEELQLPHQTLDMEELSRLYPHLRGLPVDSYCDARPRILIGMKHGHVNLTLKSREGKMYQPIAVKTRLGWTVCGGWQCDVVPSMVHYTFHVYPCDQHSDDNMHEAVKSYFALDSLGVTTPGSVKLSSTDVRAQDLLQSLTMLKGHQYETGLLWRYDDVRLPDSQTMALRRFRCLEKRMEKDRALGESLNQKIIDYLAKGYIRKLTNEELSRSYPRIWYLPIFPVTNPNKPHKVRLVWDAAAESFGVSLNSTLLKGPDQLCSLFGILLQFREHRVGLTGDIREMFHQVLIREEDQQCQRFYWKDLSGELGVYVMRVMTFGACCSPSTAQHIKNINAQRFLKEYPTAVKVITKQHYVDDMLVSVESEEEAIRLAQNVKHVHMQGGFEIRGWISNSQRVVRSLQEVNTQEKNLDLTSDIATEKVLGMWWCTASDVFTYKIGWTRYDRALLNGQRCPTKREVLRVLMTIFDPLGLISHFLMYLKVLLQDIWRAGIQWDENITGELFDKWRNWLQVLPQVENVQIPRCYRVETSLGDNCKVQLHTFVDASEKGFAAAVYLRFEQNNVVECILVAAKTRVAPLKYLSIPRLELQAAVLGARLAKTVSESLSVKISQKFYWSDSRDTVCWICSDNRRYTPYVEARTSEIHELTDVREWRWVPTKLNVADDGTKWERLPDLTQQSRWFKGPDFLLSSEKNWPQSPEGSQLTDTEVRSSLLFHYTMPEPVIIVTDYSRYSRLLRVVAYLYRFSTNCRLQHRKQLTLTGPLESTELQVAKSYLCRLAQCEGYPDEVAALTKAAQQLTDKATPIPKTSRIYRLSPWLDHDGVLRMRGRTAACKYATEDSVSPIILPRDHQVTTLIVSYYHTKYHHRNHETVINEIRQRYAISRLRVCYSNVRRICQQCKNESSIPCVPIMADLPPARLAAFSSPFTHVGIDYFGPFEVAIGRRVEKRWGMLATCLTIRAVHIEVAHSMSTNSCIMAIRNFIARRGVPRKIYSDRGTNFIGANRELKEALAAVNQEDIMKEFVSPETEWVFNPPAAPHMGGSWERLIRTVKKNLMAIQPAERPSDEVLTNLFAEIENTINSRPLTHVPIDDHSAPALTPNHFLLNSSNGSKPLTIADDSGQVLRTNYRASQVLANQYWKRWVTDYLPEITRRTRWFARTRPIIVGDVVVVVDPKLPRNCWPKGIVIQTCVSRDGCVRSATVKTANGGVYDRPVAKLAVLDVQRVAE